MNTAVVYKHASPLNMKITTRFFALDILTYSFVYEAIQKPHVVRQIDVDSPRVFALGHVIL